MECNKKMRDAEQRRTRHLPRGRADEEECGGVRTLVADWQARPRDTLTDFTYAKAIFNKYQPVMVLIFFSPFSMCFFFMDSHVIFFAVLVSV